MTSFLSASSRYTLFLLFLHTDSDLSIYLCVGVCVDGELVKCINCFLKKRLCFRWEWEVRRSCVSGFVWVSTSDLDKGDAILGLEVKLNDSFTFWCSLNTIQLTTPDSRVSFSIFVICMNLGMYKYERDKDRGFGISLSCLIFHLLMYECMVWNMELWDPVGEVDRGMYPCPNEF